MCINNISQGVKNLKNTLKYGNSYIMLNCIKIIYIRSSVTKKDTTYNW